MRSSTRAGCEHDRGRVFGARIACRCVGDVGRDLLVARVDELDRPRPAERGQDGDVGVAAKTEQVLDAAASRYLTSWCRDGLLHGICLTGDSGIAARRLCIDRECRATSAL